MPKPKSDCKSKLATKDNSSDSISDALKATNAFDPKSSKVIAKPAVLVDSSDEEDGCVLIGDAPDETFRSSCMLGNTTRT